jgi:group II intron maturase
VRHCTRVNSAKSAVARPAARKFLGFSFTDEAEPRRRIAPQALARFTSRVRALTRRTAEVSLEQAIDRLSIYLTGWRGYFGFCQTSELLRNLQGWVRRRLRCLAWSTAEAFDGMDFAVSSPLVRPDQPRYPVLIHRVTALLHASASRRRPCASLILRSIKLDRGLAPPSCRACSAHWVAGPSPATN